MSLSCSISKFWSSSAVSGCATGDLPLLVDVDTASFAIHDITFTKVESEESKTVSASDLAMYLQFVSALSIQELT
jgi:hypothetical protein